MSESDSLQDTLTESEQEEWEELVEKDPESLTDAEKTSKIKLSMKRRYSPPEWSLVFELASPNGRRADAIAVNTFPSRNFKLVGFEFKASRSDWLSEVREGGKSDYFVRACDDWYIVAWSGVVQESELPEGWGLLELKPNSERIYTQVESDLTEHQQGEPDRAFWARFIQKSVGGESEYTQQDLKEARARGYEEAEEDLADSRLDRDAKKLRDKAETVDKLREAGILDYLNPIRDRRVERMNRAMELLKGFEEENYRSFQRRLASFGDQVEKEMEEIQEMVSDLEETVDDVRPLQEADQVTDDE